MVHQMIKWGPKVETGDCSIPQLYEMRKKTECGNVSARYPEKLFKLQTLLCRVRNNTVKVF